jgi:hypothetical protein
MKKRIQGFFVGIIVSCILFSSIPVFAESINSILNSINIKVNGSFVGKVGEDYTLQNGEKVPLSISYKGTTYLPMRKLAELLGKEVIWDNQTKTASVNDKVSSAIPSKPTTATTIAPAPTLNPIKEVKIKGQGFYNQGTTTNYAVKFEDNFIVMMGIPKLEFPMGSTYEGVAVSIDLREYKGTYDSTKINIIGFSELFNEKFYPLSYRDYKSKLDDYISTELQKMDFFESCSNTKEGENNVGIVWYDSFVKLEGIEFNDGVHKCKLYLEDN